MGSWWNTKNKLLAAVLATTLLGIAVAWNGLIYPDLTRLRAVRGQKNLEMQKREVLGETREVQSRIDALAKQLPASGDISWVIQVLNDMASRCNVEITSMSSPETSRNEIRERLSFKIEAEGATHNLGRFLSRIESYSPLMTVSHFYTKRSAFRGALQAYLVVTVYHVPVAPAF